MAILQTRTSTFFRAAKWSCRDLLPKAHVSKSAKPCSNFFPVSPQCIATCRMCNFSCQFSHKKIPSTTQKDSQFLGGLVFDSQREFSGICYAKKKKGGKKKGGKKQKGSLMDIGKVAEPWKTTTSLMTLLLLIENFKRATGSPLLEDTDVANIALDIWDAPFCLLVNDKIPGEDEHKLTYANKPLLDLLKSDWYDIVGKKQSEIDESIRGLVFGDWNGKLEATVGESGKFEINGATFVEIKSPADTVQGQALAFSEWTFEDGSKGGVGITSPKEVPTEEDILNAEKSVEEQAAIVRSLKEDQGLTNQDEEVVSAVGILLERKEILADLQKRKEQAPNPVESAS